MNNESTKLDLNNLIDALKYLSNIQTGWHMINDRSAFEYIKQISKLIVDDSIKNQINKWLPSMTKHKFERLLIDTWFYLANKCSRFNPINEQDYDDLEEEIHESNIRIILLFDYITSITRELVDKQYEYNNDMLEFNRNLIHLGLLKAIITFLRDFNYDTLNNKSSDDNSLLRDTLNGVFLILLSLSESVYFIDNKKLWIDLNIESILHNIKLDTNKTDNLILNQTINKIISNMNQKPFHESIDTLLYLNRNETLNFKQSYLEFLNIYKLVSKRTFKQHAIFIQHNMKPLFLRFLNEFLRLRNELDFKYVKSIQYNYPNMFANPNEIKLSIFHYILLIINKLIFSSVELNLYFGSHALLHNFILFLKDVDFVHNTLIDSSYCILLTLIVNLSILSKYSNKNIQLWTNLNVLSTLVQFLNDIDSIEINRIKTKIIEKTYYCIGYLDGESNRIIEKLPRIDQYVEALVLEMANICKQFQSNKQINRVMIEYLDESKTLIINIVTSYLNGKTLTGLLDLLTRFCVNEQLRVIIYRRAYFIKSTVFNGNRFEKYFAIKLLNKLCLNDREIRLDLSREFDLIKYVYDVYCFNGSKNYYNRIVDENGEKEDADESIDYLDDLSVNDHFYLDLKIACEKFLQITTTTVNNKNVKNDFNSRRPVKHNHIIYDQLTRV
jgi:hypothetical protein